MGLFGFGNDARLTTLATILSYENSKGNLVISPVLMLFPPRVGSGRTNPGHVLVYGDVTCARPSIWTLIYLALRCRGGGGGVSFSPGRGMTRNARPQVVTFPFPATKSQEVKRALTALSLRSIFSTLVFVRGVYASQL